MSVASPEQLLFASTTESFLEKETPLSRVRELHDAGTSFDAQWWRRAAELAAAQRVDATDPDALAALSLGALDDLSRWKVVDVDNADAIRNGVEVDAGRVAGERRVRVRRVPGIRSERRPQ